MANSMRQALDRLVQIVHRAQNQLLHALSLVVIASLTLSALGPSASVYAASRPGVPPAGPTAAETSTPTPTASETPTTDTTASETSHGD